MDEENDEYFRCYVEKQKLLDTLKTKTPNEAVMNFLSKTEIPYVIIGGKAAAFHIGNPDTEAKKIAVASEDYDVLVPDRFKYDFIKRLVKEMDSTTMTTLYLKENESLQIYMLGWYVDKSFISYVDVHVKDNLPAHELSTGNIKYANVKWLCEELTLTIKSRSSSDERTKYMKRLIRFQLLNAQLLYGVPELSPESA